MSDTVEISSRPLESQEYLRSVERLWNQDIGVKFGKRIVSGEACVVYTVPKEYARWWKFWLRGGHP